MLGMAGCLSSVQPVSRGSAKVGGPATVDHAVASDPCPTRLHDISGALLMYYALNRQMPDKLDDLQPLAEVDRPLEFVCPVTKQPYVFVPAGLEIAGKPKRIVLHDAAPHDGVRWCILMESALPGRPPSLEVLPVQEAVFRAYVPVMN